MATANEIIKMAEYYIGTKENPANSNNVIFNTNYYGHPVSGAAYPWCCAFVWDIFRKCKASALFYDGKKTAYCQTVYNWAKEEKLTVDKTKGKKGDLVLFDWNKDKHADHIGFIKKKNSDGTYITIEGNTGIGNDSNGGEVMERTRSAATILAIVRPKYKKATKEETSKSNGAGIQPAEKKDNKFAGKYKATTSLNMRKGAGKKYGVVTILSKGAELQNFGYYTTAGGVKWLYVTYKDKVGFVSSKYIKKA
jgi:hypothetical protein